MSSEQENEFFSWNETIPTPASPIKKNFIKAEFTPTQTEGNYDSHLDILGVRRSIEAPLPIPKHMLSEDFCLKIEPQHSININDSIPNSSNFSNNELPTVKFEQTKIEYIDLHALLSYDPDYCAPEVKGSNKNVLRNFGNSQNQFLFVSKKAQQIVRRHISHPKQFEKWVRSLSLNNFKHYQEVWILQPNDSAKIKLFKKVYKKLCWVFYEDAAIPQIFSGRIKNSSTKTSHLQQLPKFLRGLKDPEAFCAFKE